jgi:hypothetical protein
VLHARPFDPIHSSTTPALIVRHAARPLAISLVLVRLALAAESPPTDHATMWRRLQQGSRVAIQTLDRGVSNVETRTVVMLLALPALPLFTIGHPAAAASSTASSASHDKSSSPSSASSSSPSSSASGPRLESPADAECPWCTEMAAGPCAAEFIAWRNCSKRIKEEEEGKDKDATTNSTPATPSSPDAPRVRPRYVTECMPLFKALNECVRTPGPKRDYYRHLLPMDDEYQPKKADVEKDLSTEEL